MTENSETSNNSRKGRPTPKRRDVEASKGLRRGPYTPPLTPKEARARRKEFKRTHTKEEIREAKRKEREERRAQQRKVQAAIDAGDERYLTARDKGEVRRYIRDWVDSRRFLNNTVMGAALVLLVILFISSSLPQYAGIISSITTLIILVFFAEGILIGWRAGRAAKAKFPGEPDTGIALRFYAYSRATQPRKWRSPKPRVELGATVD
ncbi:MAG: DUF3043 domain-containing protein [Corynebacterium sp.]|nr:DUF3043 domain-containing protein [Corynebacterium sp.]